VVSAMLTFGPASAALGQLLADTDRYIRLTGVS
jgi:hypothetical protein